MNEIEKNLKELLNDYNKMADEYRELARKEVIYRHGFYLLVFAIVLIFS
jgi:hypothetical protein